MDAFEAVACSASVPFITPAGGDALRQVFITGNVPAGLAPHIDRMLHELPIPLLARFVFAYPKSDQGAVIANFAILAKTVGAEARIDAWLNG